MQRLLRIGLGVLGTLLFVLSVFAIGALASLDWGRRHTAATAALPVLEDQRDGLVQIPLDEHVFRARVAGLDNSGPGVVLLHGFPESSITWAPLLPRLAEAGYRAVAFDQRGYSPGARPEGIAPYAIPELLDDVHAMAARLDFDRFHLVGHDWGAVLAWGMAADSPRSLRSASILSVPHPSALNPDPEPEPPLYFHFFRTRGLAEGAFAFGGFWMLRNLVYTDMPADVEEEYLAIFREPGALTGGFAWYRAAQLDSAAARLGEVSIPTLYLSGSRDVFADPAVLARQAELMTGPYRAVELDTDHWIVEHETERVTQEILAHLQRVDASPTLAARP